MGGVGRSLNRWLASAGAKKMILACRSGMATHGIQALIGEMEIIGTRVVVQACDIALESDVKDLFEGTTAQGLPPIAGVINGAMVLQVGNSP